MELASDLPVESTVASATPEHLHTDQSSNPRICDGGDEEDASVPVYGSIEGISVGSVWETREALAKSGIHKPMDSNIHLGPSGVCSLILSKEYNDKGLCVTIRLTSQKEDVEEGESDQDLPLNINKEQEVPVRVIRHHMLKNMFAPRCGYRYDGLYMVKQHLQRPVGNGRCLNSYSLTRCNKQGMLPWKSGQKTMQHPAPSDMNSMNEDVIVVDSDSDTLDIVQIPNLSHIKNEIHNSFTRADRNIHTDSSDNLQPKDVIPASNVDSLDTTQSASDNTTSASVQEKPSILKTSKSPSGNNINKSVSFYLLKDLEGGSKSQTYNKSTRKNNHPVKCIAKDAVSSDSSSATTTDNCISASLVNNLESESQTSDQLTLEHSVVNNSESNVGNIDDDAAASASTNSAKREVMKMRASVTGGMRTSSIQGTLENNRNTNTKINKVKTSQRGITSVASITDKTRNTNISVNPNKSQTKRKNVKTSQEGITSVVSISKKSRYASDFNASEKKLTSNIQGDVKKPGKECKILGDVKKPGKECKILPTKRRKNNTYIDERSRKKEKLLQKSVGSSTCSEECTASHVPGNCRPIKRKRCSCNEESSGSHVLNGEQSVQSGMRESHDAILPSAGEIIQSQIPDKNISNSKRTRKVIPTQEKSYFKETKGNECSLVSKRKQKDIKAKKLEEEAQSVNGNEISILEKDLVVPLTRVTTAKFCEIQNGRNSSVTVNKMKSRKRPLSAVKGESSSERQKKSTQLSTTSPEVLDKNKLVSAKKIVLKDCTVVLKKFPPLVLDLFRKGEIVEIKIKNPTVNKNIEYVDSWQNVKCVSSMHYYNECVEEDWCGWKVDVEPVNTEACSAYVYNISDGVTESQTVICEEENNPTISDDDVDDDDYCYFDFSDDDYCYFDYSDEDSCCLGFPT